MRPATRVGTLPRAGFAVALLAAAALLTGCTASQPMPTPTPTPTATPIGDGVLRIGTLFPSTGATAFLAPPQLDGVKAAVADINAAGGVNGKPVVLLSDDSGDATTQTAEASLADLVKKGADVIIGPSSSVLSQRLLTAAAAAQVALISPAATYPQLSTLDTQNVFFRTIPSTALQGVALGTLLPSKKQLKVALVAGSDPDRSIHRVHPPRHPGRARRRAGGQHRAHGVVGARPMSSRR